MRNLRLSLALVAVACLLPLVAARATLIERDFTIQLGTVVEDANNPSTNGEILQGVGLFFRDDPITANVGDIIRLNLSFADHKAVQVFDLGEPNLEIVSIGIGIEEGEGLVTGTWLGSLSLVDAHGDAGPSPQTKLFNGGGGGIGLGSTYDLTDHQVLFRGVTLEFNILSGQGFPASFSNLTGLQVNADRVRVVPVPEPITLCLLAFGVFAAGIGRRSRPPV